MHTIKAEIVTIGDEILYGQITDTNSQWLGEELTKIGVKVVRKTSIGDRREEILEAFASAIAKVDIVITTGGLGPTKDDITKKTFAEFFGVDMRFDEPTFAHLTELLRARNRLDILDLNRSQAEVPANAEVITNLVGTAPGMWLPHGGKVFVSMPGVPHEMKKMMSEQVLPRMKAAFNPPVIYHKIVKTIGIAESKLAHVISDWEDALPAHMGLAYLPKLGQVKLRMTATGTDLAQLQAETEAEAAKLRALIGNYIYAYEDEDLEVAIGRMLKARNQTLAIAESCTGGYVASQLTHVAGSSAYFMGGIVAYSNEVKISQLGVNAQDIAAHGAVSETVARQMAENVRLRYNATWGIATTGIAGPSGGTPEKPVGTVYIACSNGTDTVVKLLNLSKDRHMNIQFSFSAILNLLRQEIEK